ncbi:N-acetyllactosaminide alpha-1,3-galactosyltransferase-like [Sorex araneus]|uniref:N-acetyllactosaminide alpha-1,3-galactosyltransferase-like n=1 Tax=Sorex araneus TaxID=42254 RepID=UPI002433CC2B|nr:N-acetyllactosaminide alpha-1,3-galactosyltransferase-like [Sorex araneus]
MSYCLPAPLRSLQCRAHYVKNYLRTFLSTADRHFMVGQKVIIYVMTDDLAGASRGSLSLQRPVRVFPIERQERWQDISMMRMKTLSEHIAAHIQHEVDFLFCMDVDLVFQKDYGPETLGESVAQIHAYWYNRNPALWPYDRSGRSAASMTSGEGDFYYHAAVFGGTPQRVLHLTRTCAQGILKDKQNHVEAVWHDESHLNKYFFLHKPSKLLSPEYCWDFRLNKEDDVNVIKKRSINRSFPFKRK